MDNNALGQLLVIKQIRRKPGRFVQGSKIAGTGYCACISENEESMNDLSTPTEFICRAKCRSVLYGLENPTNFSQAQDAPRI